MHPIVHEFINSGERLPILLEKHYDQNQFLEKVFFKVSQALYQENIDPQLYIEIDEAVVKGHSDTSVYLLFISFASIFLSIRLDLERAKVLQSIGSTILREKFHPVEQAYFIQSTAFFKLFSGHSAECNALIKESVALLDKKSPRYLVLLLNSASLLSNQGLLNELEKEDLAILNATTNKDDLQEHICVELKIRNCIYTGNFIEGYAIIDKYKMKNKAENKERVIKVATNLLTILSGDFDENSYEEEEIKLYAKACYFLSTGQADKSIQYSRLIQKGNFANIFTLNFMKYLPLQIELSFGNKGMSRLLLKEIVEKGNSNYLDDFFLARVQLLEKNIDGAYESFGRLIENVKRYGAMNRLLFEMQFAIEMQTTDILMLMSSINDEDILKNLKNKKEQPAISVKIEKGVQLLIGDSQAITQLKELVKKFAKLKQPVLITGETGTGKELVSRAIHEEGPNSHEPFLAINCGALSESLLQSELFGYVAGAFTGAQKEHKGIFQAAGRGTVFLDEFGDISPKLQVSLLRVLESNEIRLIGGASTRQIECKIVIATNTDLHQAVIDKKFREDLFFRLTRFDIKLPPLRQRKEDIPHLINFFFKDQTKIPQKLSKELLEKLMEYHWPGNIRELKNEMERLKILYADKEILELGDFDFSRLQGTESFKHENFILEKSIPPIKTVIKERKIDERVFSIVQRGSKVDQRLDLLHDIFIKFKKLTRMQVIAILAVSPVTATKDLEALCGAGIIKKIKPTKSVKSFYFTLVE